MCVPASFYPLLSCTRCTSLSHRLSILDQFFGVPTNNHFVDHFIESDPQLPAPVALDISTGSASAHSRPLRPASRLCTLYAVQLWHFGTLSHVRLSDSGEKEVGDGGEGGGGEAARPTGGRLSNPAVEAITFEQTGRPKRDPEAEGFLRRGDEERWSLVMRNRLSSLVTL
jgi:hypothetical protein